MTKITEFYKWDIDLQDLRNIQIFCTPNLIALAPSSANLASRSFFQFKAFLTCFVGFNNSAAYLRKRSQKNTLFLSQNSIEIVQLK